MLNRGFLSSLKVVRKYPKACFMALKPYLKHVKSYIRDSVDFLNKCPREVDPDTEIVTFDVTSLYTSIPHKYGLKALGYFLTTFKEEKRIPDLTTSLF